MDVFLSFTRKGHPELALRVREVLEGAGIPVFVDTGVPTGESISRHLADELFGSRLLVVVYSAAFPGRHACQWELIQAYLAGAAEGDPTGRILVINPEPGNGHIVPAAIRDSMYLRPADLDRLPQAVRAKLARLPRPMSAVARRDQPRWLPPAVPGVHGFVGRFPDLWRLHDALTSLRRPLTQPASADPVIMVTGLGGIGKTSLVRAYAWFFGEAHPGGVHWISVGGPGGIGAARRRFDDQLRDLAETVGIPVREASDARIRLLFGAYLDRQGLPCLWIIDDLPADATLDGLAAFLLPSRFARHACTTRRGGIGPDVARVPLDGLDGPDALRLLDGFREVTDTDRDAATTVIARLGGHPLALRAAGAVLEDQHGRMSYGDYAVTLNRSGTGDTVLAAIQASMAALSERARVIVSLAGVLAPAAVPVALLAAAEADLGAGLPPAATDPLRELARHGAASRIDETWLIHPLAIDAVARLGAPVVPINRIAAAAARALAGLMAATGPAAGSAGLLGRHAEVLAGHRDQVGADLADTLRRLVAARHEHVGDPVRAAALRYEIAAANPDSGADQAAYALAGVTNGEYTRAAERARLALSSRVDADTAVQARWALAAALDGLGRFGEADELWSGLDHTGWRPGRGQRIAFDVARARALIARGRLRDAGSILEPLAASPLDADADQVNAARIELSRLLLLTSSERRARELAAEVVTWYRERDAAEHVRCLEAELVWAEAAVSLDLFELRPDTSKWVEAAATLERLDSRYGAAAVPDSVADLTVAVLRSLVLVRLGRQQECRAVLLPRMERIRAELGERHPLHLRARYILSLAHLQLRENAQAAAMLAETWQAQHDVLGPGHPDTLASQLEYGIVLKFTGRPKRSAELIDDVCRRLPKEIGRRNDLYGRAQFAKRMLPFLPAVVLRSLQDFERLLSRFQRGK